MSLRKVRRSSLLQRGTNMTSKTEISTKRATASRLKRRGLVLAPVGLVAWLLGYGIQSGATSQSGLMFWGAVGALGSLVALGGIIILAVGIIRSHVP